MFTVQTLGAGLPAAWQQAKAASRLTVCSPLACEAAYLRALGK